MIKEWTITMTTTTRKSGLESGVDKGNNGAAPLDSSRLSLSSPSSPLSSPTQQQSHFRELKQLYALLVLDKEKLEDKLTQTESMLDTALELQNKMEVTNEKLVKRIEKFRAELESKDKQLQQQQQQQQQQSESQAVATATVPDPRRRSTSSSGGGGDDTKPSRRRRKQCSIM